MNTNTPREYLALPSYKDVYRADFCLCLWISKEMRAQALDDYLKVWDWESASEVLNHSLLESLQQLRYQADEAAKELTEEGGLLYAFLGTKRDIRAMKGDSQ